MIRLNPFESCKGAAECMLRVVTSLLVGYALGADSLIVMRRTTRCSLYFALKAQAYVTRSRFTRSTVSFYCFNTSVSLYISSAGLSTAASAASFG